MPLAKWPMLIAGNYRCIRPNDMIPIKEAVHGDVGESRGDLRLGVRICARRLGAESADLVPFEKYAKAAEGLGKPSSAARALFAGAEHIERVDRLVAGSRASGGCIPTRCTRSSTLVDERLDMNRQLARRNAA